MKSIIANMRYVMYIPVVMSILASIAAFVWGAVKTVKLIYSIALAVAGYEAHASHIELIAIMDMYLIATALFIFGLGLYELFIEAIEYPQWLAIKDLHSLKTKLGSIIILVMAVTFLERLSEWKDPSSMLMFAVGIAVVSAALIAFSHFGGKD